MGPLFINQNVRRRNSSSKSSSGGGSVLEVPEGDNNNQRVDSDSTIPTTKSKSDGNNASVNGNVVDNTNGNSHVRSTSSSTSEDFSNEDFPHCQKMQRKNRISVTSVNKGMNPGQYLNPRNHHHQHQQKTNPSSNPPQRLLQKSQSNSQIASGDFSSPNNSNINGINGIFTPHNVNNNSNGSNSNGIRKYLVLLQDCLAIKFASVGQPHHSQHFAFNSNNNHGMPMSANVNGNNHSPNSRTTTGGMADSSTAEVDHSLHGLYLYKGFREANLKCYWNATLCEAIRHLEYKGYLVPSTILVFAPSRLLTVLRTAWSRKMLRNPAGYRVEFVGEIEEIIAEPIPQGQFAPLSDSLCWAILEITSSGQEAFVDSILFALSTAFPLMSLPPRELVYQTLEKLIRDRKIYQTSHGYFVVTPDTFRYMNSGGDCSQYASNLPLDALISSFYESDKLSQHSWESSGSANAADDLLLGIKRNQLHSPLKRHNSLKVIRQRDLDLLMPSMGARSLSFRLSKTKSVFESDREDKPSSSNRSSTLDSRTEGSTLASDSKDDKDEQDKRSKAKPKQKSRKKASFFQRWFSFRRSKPKSKDVETLENNPQVQLESLPRSPRIYSSISKARQHQNHFHNNNAATQTACRSYEDILDLNVGDSPENEQYDYNYLQSSMSTKKLAKCNSLPSSGSKRSRSRRSILDDSPFYDTLIYNRNNGSMNRHSIIGGDNIVENNGQKYLPKSTASSSLGYGSQRERPQSLIIQNPSSNLIHNSHAYSSIAGSTERVGQYRPRHLGANNNTAINTHTTRTDSPCPSTSASAIYASIANGNNVPTPINHVGSYKNLTFSDVYKRRHPSQGSLSYRGANRYASRPKSAYELLAHQNMQNSNRKKSTESLIHNQQNFSNNNNNSGLSTTVTQNVTSTSTTSTDIEVVLPIGKLMNAALSSSSRLPSKSNGKSEIDLLENSSESTLKMRSKPSNITTETSVTTTVNNSGSVETHFSSTDNILVDNINNNCNKDSSDVSH